MHCCRALTLALAKLSCLSNAGGMRNRSFRFSISYPVPEMFAIKVWSGGKSPEILRVFYPQFFFLGGGGVLPNFGLNLSNRTSFRSCGSFTAIGRWTSERTWRKKKERKKLEVRGRARREAARRRKSEWKVNLSNLNSSRSNGSWRVTT